MNFDVELNSNWKPLSEINIKKEGKYLVRSKDKTYKNYLRILDLSNSTWKNGLWTFLSGNSFQLNQTFIDTSEFCGPIILNN